MHVRCRFLNSVILCKWVICDVRIFPISIDRTFLLISWDPSGVSVGNMPFHLVVQNGRPWNPPACLCGINTPG